MNALRASRKFFNTESEAKVIADAISDDDVSAKVVFGGKYFFIELYESNELIGYWGEM